MKKSKIGNVPVSYFLNDDIKMEKSAMDELECFLETQETLVLLNASAKIREVSITPDFHKGRGIPVGTTIFTEGFVIPQAIGNDINCGMRVYKTNLTKEKIQNELPKLEKCLRYIFFEGGRNIPMNNIQREAMLKEGLIGLLETHHHSKNTGLWQHYDKNRQERDLNFVNKMGSFITVHTHGLEDFIGKSNFARDDQIGSIGGGNHFVEFQEVSKLMDAATAHQWGLKSEQVIVMIHTGSVGIGHHCGTLIRELLKRSYPKHCKHPENGIYPLIYSEKTVKDWDIFWSLLHNAANFAFANRVMLGLMAQSVLDRIFGEVEYELLYDAPHNYVWEEEIDGVKGYLHRKGSCTAKNMMQMQNTPFAFTGEPVMIPGSMGASSYILKGLGNRESLFSASHGAGRAMSRGKASKVSDEMLQNFMNQFKIITPIDPNRTDIAGREDILSKWREEVKKEAPFAYKEILPVIQSHTNHKMADIVVETKPILTIKG